MPSNKQHTRFNANAPFALVPAGPVPYSGLQVFGHFLLAFFPLMSLVVCCLRVYSRRLSKGFGLDDWLIFLAMALAIPQAVFASLSLRLLYWGLHEWEIPKHPPNQGFFWTYMDRVFYNPLLALVKVSALIFLLRLGGTRDRVRWACKALMWFNVLQLFAFLPVVVFSCDPIEFIWNSTKTGRCLDTGTFSIFTGCTTIVTDILTLIIPYCVFLNLHVNKKVRNALLAVFTMGALVTAISGLRLYSLVRLFYLKPSDSHYSIGYTTTTIEVNLAIITASVPALWPLARRWFPGVFESLGINRPYMYADIEVGYATKRSINNSRASHTPNSLRAKISWKEHKHVPSGVYDYYEHGDKQSNSNLNHYVNYLTDIRSQKAMTKDNYSGDLDDDDMDILKTYHGIIRKTSIIVLHEDDVNSDLTEQTPR
ncbi:hypothetical protein B0H63DRAFT_5656 [Podospora didyma]|uniref:Rhodopsin domain-containing protein n=1 Tax=Podospora didyma TaxID=330526 RepID=A0AAE0P400_9PEZI|nr:hypothetical protein B0H63DRAFT_5656 [Podospora didyma]